MYVMHIMSYVLSLLYILTDWQNRGKLRLTKPEQLFDRHMIKCKLYERKSDHVPYYCNIQSSRSSITSSLLCDTLRRWLNVNALN